MFDNRYKAPSKGTPFVVYQKNYIPQKARFYHLHHHDDFEIIYPVCGCAQMQVGGEVQTVREGELLLIHPYEVHSWVTSDRELEYYCLDFDIKQLSLPTEAKILADEIRYPALLRPPLSNKLIPYLRHAIHAYTEEAVGWELAVRGNLLLFFSSITSLAVTASPNKSNIFTKAVLTFIEDHYTQPITSAEAAAALSYNQSHFCRLFRKNFATSFSSFLNEYKIKKAKYCLREYNVSQAAALSGFDNQSYFSQVFRQSTGMTPSAYKKQLSRK